MAQSQPPETEAEVVRCGAAVLAERLPKGWSTSVETDSGPGDLRIAIRDPAGSPVTLLVEVKRVVEGRDVGS